MFSLFKNNCINGIIIGLFWLLKISDIIFKYF